MVTKIFSRYKNLPKIVAEDLRIFIILCRLAWKTPSCICSCQWCIKSEVFCGNCWMLRRRLEAATCCRRGLQYDGKCSFYLNCYFFRTSPTNRDLREKAVYFPPRFGCTMFTTSHIRNLSASKLMGIIFCL